MHYLRILSCALLATLGGCAMPQWRVFQAKVDPSLAQKPVGQIEAERRAAAFIRDSSAAPAADPVAQVASIHAVAAPLASSLGEPKVAATVADQSTIVAELRRGVLAEQKKTEQWKAFAEKYAGKPIEDTGLNLAGPAGLLFVVAGVAVVIACPSLGYVLWRIIPRLWGYFRQTTAAVSEFAQANPDAGAKLAVSLRGKMDSAHKSMVKHWAKAQRIPKDIAHAPTP